MSKQQKADSVYKMLTRKSNKPKSSSPPLIELRKILNGELKLREDNPKLRLSIEDYNLMCKNKILRKMMAKILNIDIDILTAYCKDVKILEEYVDLSQRTIKEKAKAKLLPIKTLLSDLPADSIRLITGHYQSLLKYKLVDWFPQDKLRNHFVSYNPNAIDFLSIPENRIFIDWEALSGNSNPDAIDFLSLPENKKHIDWDELSYNPNAIDFLSLPENKKHIDWKSLSENTNSRALELLEKEIMANPNNPNINWYYISRKPEAIQILKNNFKKINWEGLSSNPGDNAIKFLKENPEYIHIGGLLLNTNPKVIPLIAKKIKEIREENVHTKNINNSLNNWLNWFALCANPNAIDLLQEQENEKHIQWTTLSSNPGIFIPNNKNIRAKSKIVARILSSNLPTKAKAKAKTGITDLPNDLHKKIVNDFISISKNILRDGIPIDKLHWHYLSRNPNAIDLIRVRISFENKLSKEEYDRLPSKIDWSYICSKPELLDLTRERIYYENKLSKEEYDRLPSKIDWSILSNMPEAINILKENYSKYSKIDSDRFKLDWGKLSSNPAAIKLLEEEYNKNHETTKINWNALSANPGIFILI